MTGPRSFTKHWLPIDWACACYVGAASVALTRDASGVAGWGWLAVAHVLMAGLICVAPSARGRGGSARDWGEWDPVVVLSGLLGAQAG